VPADGGHALQCRVTSGGTSASPPRSPWLARRVEGLPAVARRAGHDRDEHAACVTGPWADADRFEYLWWRDGKDIPGATAVSYKLVPEDGGHAVQCVVIARDSTGAVAAASSAIGVPACVVPRVWCMSQSTTTSRLKSSGCTPGRTWTTHSRYVRKGRVVKTKPRTGATLAYGSRVDLYVAR